MPTLSEIAKVNQARIVLEIENDLKTMVGNITDALLREATRGKYFLSLGEQYATFRALCLSQGFVDKDFFLTYPELGQLKYNPTSHALYWPKEGEDFGYPPSQEVKLENVWVPPPPPPPPKSWQIQPLTENNENVQCPHSVLDGNSEESEEDVASYVCPTCQKTTSDTTCDHCSAEIFTCPACETLCSDSVPCPRCGRDYQNYLSYTEERSRD